MTVSYTHLSHTAGWVGGLTRLLFIWKGSLFKQIFPDFTLFFSLYAALSLLYRCLLVDYEDHKIQYELFCVYCDKFSKVIPISFLLGFYVTQVVSRWWAQFMSLPWPDTLARYLAVYLPGTDPVSRNYRRTVCRWVNLGNVLALRLVSYKVMVRFPTYEHLVESGLATNKEMIVLKQLNELVQNRHQISWFPNMWAQNLLRKARRENLIANDWFTHVLIKEVDNMANLNGMLICYGWINIPLVYTQVITLAVYAYFLALLFGRQYLLPTQYKVEGDKWIPVAKFASLSDWHGTLTPGAQNIIGYDNDVADFVIPLFTILEFLFYMGWLKVAETLLNPFGEDDDDFDTYYLIDRNLQISYVMSDEAGQNVDPEMDPFNSERAPELKYTELATTFLDDLSPTMPTDNLNLTEEQTKIATNVRDSQKNLTQQIGSKLNLAGHYLSSPVSELNTNGKLGRHRRSIDGSYATLIPGEGVDGRPFNMATHIIGLEEGTVGVKSRRHSKMGPVSGISIIPEGEEPNSVVKKEFLADKSPLTSRNESMLFAVPKVCGQQEGDKNGEPTPPRYRSVSESVSENLRERDVAPRIMMIEEGDDKEDDGDGNDQDMDVFDALGLR